MRICIKKSFAVPVLVAVVGVLMACSSQAQFNYTVTNQMVTITGYTGTNDVVDIPSTINGMPVTSIESDAFYGWSSITSVTIPNSVTNIGNYAFGGCGLTNVTIPNSVASIGDSAFEYCSSLTNIMVDPLNSAYSGVDGVLFNHSQTTLVEYPGGKVGSYMIPNSVTSIGDYAFASCSGLTSLTIPNSVTSIGDYAFGQCSKLTSVYFQGNAPSVGGTDVFFGDNATLYYLPGTVGWSSTFAGSPTALWTLPYPLILNLGVRSNQFGFTVSWTTNLSVVVEASTDLASPIWSSVQTNALSGGTFYFSDPQWKNYPTRFYRVRSQ